MKNRKKIGLIGGIAALAVILCIAAVVILTRNGGNEDYRDISVFDLSASATVTRDGTTLDAYSGMKLMNGDNVKVGDEGNMCLLLDGDKYVTLETGTEIRLNASGNNENSKTKIELVQGAVLNELDSKLNNDSSYELSTPVSVMAVRGTVFRVSLKSECDSDTADVMVFDGKVATAAVLSDGTISPDENMVGVGEAASYQKTGADSNPVYAPKEFNLQDLPTDTLKAILNIYESGRISDFSISKDELQQLIKDKESADSTDEDENNTTDPASGTDPSDTNSAGSGGPASNTDADSSDDDSAAPDSSDDDDDSANYGSGSGSGSASDSDGSDGTVSNPGSKSGNNSGSASDKKSGKKSSKKSDAKSDKKSGKTSDKKSDSNKKPKSTKTPVPVPQQTSNPVVDKPATPAPGNATYTVTFIDPLGRVFGTQSIAAGSRAQKPVLSPAGGTNWCDAGGNVFNFDTAITGDLTLYYR